MGMSESEYVAITFDYGKEVQVKRLKYDKKFEGFEFRDWVPMEVGLVSRETGRPIQRRPEHQVVKYYWNKQAKRWYWVMLISFSFWPEYTRLPVRTWGSIRGKISEGAD